MANILSLSGNQSAETSGGTDMTMTPATPLRNCATWQQTKKARSEEEGTLRSTEAAATSRPPKRTVFLTRNCGTK